MQGEKNTIGFLSQIGKTLEIIYNWRNFEYPEETECHFNYVIRNNDLQLHKINVHMLNYLNRETQNMLNKKMAYYASNDYKVHMFLKKK